MLCQLVSYRTCSTENLLKSYPEVFSKQTSIPKMTFKEEPQILSKGITGNWMLKGSLVLALKTLMRFEAQAQLIAGATFTGNSRRKWNA